MNYKKNVRNPQYGKVFMKDKNGRVEEVLDVLKIVVVHNDKNYTIGDLLGFVAENEHQINKIQKLESALKEQSETARELSKLAIMFDARLKTLEVKK